MVWLVLACVVQGGKFPQILADHLVFNFFLICVSVSVSQYQRFSLKGNHKDLDILVFGTNTPAGWHYCPYCNTNDNSGDLCSVSSLGMPQEKTFHLWSKSVKKWEADV